MAPTALRLVSDSHSPLARSAPRRELGQVLQMMGLMDGATVASAQAQADALSLSLGRYLRHAGTISTSALLQAQSRASGIALAEQRDMNADPRLIDRLGASRCIRDGVVPLRSVGGAILVAVHAPEALEGLTIGTAPLIPLLADKDDIHAAVLARRGKQLSARAEQRTDVSLSVRQTARMGPRWVLGALAFVGFFTWIAPGAFAVAALAVSVLAMGALMALKLFAALNFLWHGPVREVIRSDVIPLAPLPEISILVPLFKEREIARKLIGRLTRLEYPRALLDICLVVEGDDSETLAILQQAKLPHWFRVIEVPAGTVRTKPRALNYALDFARGSVVGILDAEDAPDPDQLHIVADHFRTASDNVACLQGTLDYYNPWTSWLTRCFAIEYAAWFRIILPALSRLGWPVPLGGTTVYFRRAALEELGAWDAHNVTEDADLGLRLARKGYRTELIATKTREEATRALRPWIRQRSRWLKGYALTYAVHMRAPRRLIRDLGPWGFAGVQVLFAGTLLQFLLAPLLWSLWPAAFGLWHPMQGLLGAPVTQGLAIFFLGAGAVSVLVSCLAARARHRRLLWWVPALALYFPFATIAAIRGMGQILSRPYFWDKTRHGV